MILIILNMSQNFLIRKIGILNQCHKSIYSLEEKNRLMLNNVQIKSLKKLKEVLEQNLKENRHQI